MPSCPMAHTLKERNECVRAIRPTSLTIPASYASRQQTATLPDSPLCHSDTRRCSCSCRCLFSSTQPQEPSFRPKQLMASPLAFAVVLFVLRRHSERSEESPQFRFCSCLFLLLSLPLPLRLYEIPQQKRLS